MRTRYTMHFLAALGTALLIAKDAFCAVGELDSVKMLVQHDRMYQVTGEDLAAAVDACNTMPVTEYRLGRELLTAPGAARGHGAESQKLGGYVGMNDAKPAVLDGASQPDLNCPSRYCVKVDAGPSQLELRTPFCESVFEGGKRYALSCKMYCDEPGRIFDMGYISKLSGYSGTVKPASGYLDEPSHNVITSQPGKWVEVSGWAVAPDVGDHEFQLWFKCRGQGRSPWLLDDVSVREVETVQTARIYRPKTPSEAGFALSGIAVNRVNVYHLGETVPIAVEHAEPGGVMGRETQITFWGESPRVGLPRESRYTRENAYILRFDSPDPPHRYRPTQPLPRPSRGKRVTTAFRKTAHIEKNSTLDRERFIGEPTDYSMWLRCWSYGRAQIRLAPLYDVAAGHRPEAIRISLWGRSHLPANPDHHWQILLNENAIGESVWDGREHYLFESSTLAGSFRAGEENVMRFAVSGKGSGIDSIALDWIEIDYEASLTPQQDFLAYALSGTPDNDRVRLGPGFSAPPIRVFGRDGDAELVTSPPGRSSKDGYSCAYVYPLGGEARAFRAVGPEGFVKPERLIPGRASRLKDIAEIPEYLIITHRFFREDLMPLLAHREAQGMRAMAVDVEDIYDEYSHGLFSPHAIRAFLDDLLNATASGESGLRYVFLVGDATYDYLDVNKGLPNLVPTYHLEDGGLSDSLPLVAQDDYYVYGDQNGIRPRAAVGRLACDRPETVRNYVAKVLEYERAHRGGPSAWARTAVLIDGWDFSRFTEQLATEELAGWVTHRISSAGDPTTDAGHQKRIVAALNGGCGIVNFVGHGSNYVWRTASSGGMAGSDLFTRGHLDLLTNQGMYPIVLTATCFSTLFDEPGPAGGAGKSGIGVFLVEAKDKGAIAVIGHVGKATVTASQDFNRAVAHAMLQGSTQRLGDAFLAAKKQLENPQCRGIALLGDPALMVGQYYGKGE
jgi:Peptidase family C25